MPVEMLCTRITLSTAVMRTVIFFVEPFPAPFPFPVSVPDLCLGALYLFATASLLFCPITRSTIQLPPSNRLYILLRAVCNRRGRAFQSLFRFDLLRSLSRG